jgi:hypothetical protein
VEAPEQSPLSLSVKSGPNSRITKKLRTFYLSNTIWNSRNNLRDRAIAQAVRCCHLTSEPRAQSRVKTTSEVTDARRGIGSDIFEFLQSSPHFHRFNIASYFSGCPVALTRRHIVTSSVLKLGTSSLIRHLSDHRVKKSVSKIAGKEIRVCKEWNLVICPDTQRIAFTKTQTHCLLESSSYWARVHRRHEA